MARKRNDNDRLLDEQLLGYILALARSRKLSREVINILNETEPKLAGMIRNSSTGLVSRSDLREMEELIRDVRNMRAIAWRRIETLLRREFERQAKARPRELRSAIREVSDDKITMPTEAAILAILGRKFEGRTLAEWIKTQERNDAQRIATQIRLGRMLREPPERIARRVLGEARVVGANGATESARRRLTELVGLAGVFVLNAAQREFFVVNDGIFDRELYVAVLDDRTTNICRSLNGKVFAIGSGPYPPLHFWCRSVRIALLRGVGPPLFEGFAAWLALQDEETRDAVRDATRR